jgi:predicted amidohydrolase
MRAALIPCGGFRDSCDATEVAGKAIAEAAAKGAALICLPHLSFLPYFPAECDRSALEFAERPPAKSYFDALAVASPVWLAASVYESEGEGVFYVTAMLGRVGQVELRYRQVAVEAKPGRLEQMFWSPGHSGYGVCDVPWGRTSLLVGSDLRTSQAYSALVDKRVQVLVGGASEDEETWAGTCRLVTGMASLHGFAALVVNRQGVEYGAHSYPGGVLAVDNAGRTLRPDGDGLYEIAGGSSEGN